MEEIIAVFGINWKLVFIQAVNFGILLLILWWFLYRPLARIVSERQQVIEKGVKDAQAAETKLADIEDEKSSIIKSATEEGETIVKRATDTAREKEAAMVADANAKTERIIADAGAKAEEIKRLAHEESKAEIARVAVLSAEKILKERA